MTALAVMASGMVTSVGFNAASTCAAMRARIRNVKETNLWDASSGEYIAAGRVSLPQWWIGVGKLAELVAPAIQECLVAARPAKAQDIPLLICICAPSRPHRFAGLEEQLLDEVAHRLQVDLHPASAVIAHDQVSVAVGIAHAEDLITRREAANCIVAGADSLIDQPLVDHYLAARRILTPTNSNGFSPGEAGSAVLIGTATSAAGGALEILGMGTSFESAGIEGDEPLRGDGLTDAIRDALADAGLSIADVQYRISDLNGEHYKFKEMVLAVLRFERQRRKRLFDLWHPNEYVGDIGAAIGPLVLGVALQAMRKRYAPGPTTLCTFGNDTGERAAIVVSYRD